MFGEPVPYPEWDGLEVFDEDGLATLRALNALMLHLLEDDQPQHDIASLEAQWGRS